MISKLNKFKHLISRSQTQSHTVHMRRAFAVDVSAMNKDLNKCKIRKLKNVELKISLS